MKPEQSVSVDSCKHLTGDQFPEQRLQMKLEGRPLRTQSRMVSPLRKTQIEKAPHLGTLSDT